MASKDMLLHTKNYIFTHQETEINQITTHHENLFEFDEADIWNNNNNNNSSGSTGAISSFEVKKMLPKKSSAGRNIRTPGTCASSLPVNVPNWSKICRKDQENDYDIDDDDDHEIRVPIHEYLAKRRGASFSVHEGIGRTLKGRDLRQVRNAIWKQVGFED